MIWELCRQEAFKLFSQKHPYLLLVATVAMQMVRMLALALSKPETSMDIVSGPQLWAEGLGWALRTMVFVVLVTGAMSFSREFSLGTAKTVLMLPVTRRAWYGAKLLSLLGVAWGLLLASTLLGMVFVAFTTGWGDLVREGLVIYEAAAFWKNIALATALTGIFLLPLCAFSLLVGMYFRNSGAAVGVALLLGMMLESVAGLLNVGQYLFIFHLHRPADLIGRMGRGLPFSWEQTVSVGLTTALISFAVLALWALVRLERMDITV